MRYYWLCRLQATAVLNTLRQANGGVDMPAGGTGRKRGLPALSEDSFLSQSVMERGTLLLTPKCKPLMKELIRRLAQGCKFCLSIILCLELKPSLSEAFCPSKKSLALIIVSALHI
jgi:hypothetical protein